MMWRCMPFNAQTLTELFVAILRDPIEPVLNLRGDCPPELEQIILRAMSRDAKDRYQSANEMRNTVRVMLGRHDQSATCEKYRCNLRHSSIKTERCELQHSRRLADCKTVHLGGGEVGNAGMRNAHRFGGAG